MKNQLKDYRPHKLRFNPYLEKLYQSDKPIIIYKVEDVYNIYKDLPPTAIFRNFASKLTLSNLISEYY